MFFCPELLLKRKHPFFLVWIASTQQGQTLKKYLTYRKVREIHLDRVVRDILKIVVTNLPTPVPRPFSPRLKTYSLYLSAKLMYGCCILLRKQAAILFDDLKNVNKNVNELKFSAAKNEIVRYITRTLKARDERLLSADPDNNFSNADETLPNFEYFVDDDEPLTFPNSVPEAHVTMQEDLIFPSATEDQRFGDEGDAYYLQQLISNDVTEGAQHFYVPLSEDLSVAESQPTSTRQRPQLEHPTEIQRDPPITETETATDTQPSVTSIFLTGIVGDIGLSELELPSQIHESLLAEGLTDQPLDAVSPALEHPTGFQQSVTEDSAVAPSQFENQEICPAQLLSDSLSPIRTQREDAQDPSSEMQLADVILPPKSCKRKRKKHQNLIVDDLTQISSPILRAQIENKGVDTLQKETVYHQAMSRFIKTKWFNLTAMKQPGRSGFVNQGFQRMFSRHLVTRPAPDLQELSHHEVVQTESHREETVESERVREETVESVRVGKSGMLLDQSSYIPADQGLLEIGQEEHLSVPENLEIEFNHSSINPAPLPLTPPSKRSRSQVLPTVAGTVASFVLADPQQDNMEDTAKIRELRKRKRDNVIGDNRDTDIPKRRSLGLATESQLEETEEQGLDLVDENAQEKETEERGLDLVDENAQEKETEERGLDLVDDNAQEKRSEPVDKLDGRATPSSLSPQSSLTPIVDDDIFQKVVELAKDRKVERILMEDLCPQTTKRRKAAGMFYALLGLHQKKKVKLTQERDGDNVGPICITVMNNTETA